MLGILRAYFLQLTCETRLHTLGRALRRVDGFLLRVLYFSQNLVDVYFTIWVRISNWWFHNLRRPQLAVIFHTLQWRNFRSLADGILLLHKLRDSDHERASLWVIMILWNTIAELLIDLWVLHELFVSILEVFRSAMYGFMRFTLLWRNIEAVSPGCFFHCLRNIRS